MDAVPRGLLRSHGRHAQRQSGQHRRRQPVTVLDSKNVQIRVWLSDIDATEKRQDYDGIKSREALIEKIQGRKSPMPYFSRQLPLESADRRDASSGAFLTPAGFPIVIPTRIAIPSAPRHGFPMLWMSAGEFLVLALIAGALAEGSCRHGLRSSGTAFLPTIAGRLRFRLSDGLDAVLLRHCENAANERPSASAWDQRHAAWVMRDEPS